MLPENQNLLKKRNHSTQLCFFFALQLPRGESETFTSPHSLNLRLGTTISQLTQLETASNIGLDRFCNFFTLDILLLFYDLPLSKKCQSANSLTSTFDSGSFANEFDSLTHAHFRRSGQQLTVSASPRENAQAQLSTCETSFSIFMFSTTITIPK